MFKLKSLHYWYSNREHSAIVVTTLGQVETKVELPQEIIEIIEQAVLKSFSEKWNSNFMEKLEPKCAQKKQINQFI